MASLRFAVLAAALCASAVLAMPERRMRVVEGSPDKIEKAPWLVQVVYADSQGLSKVNTCAGSIVGPRQVLTSAHCFPKGTPYAENPDKFMAILAGVTNKVDREGGDLYNIKAVSIHPKAFDDADKLNQMYDLAVVTVNRDFNLGKGIQIIELAKKQVSAGTKVMGGGWGVRMHGAAAEPESFAPTLITAEMSVNSPEWCQSYFSLTDLNKEAQKALLCMKPITGMPCNGDSGSGLWKPAGLFGKPHLVGVLQGGVVCDVQEGTPFYVDIQHPNVRDFLISTGVKV